MNQDRFIKTVKTQMLIPHPSRINCAHEPCKPNGMSEVEWWEEVTMVVAGVASSAYTAGSKDGVKAAQQEEIDGLIERLEKLGAITPEGEESAR